MPTLPFESSEGRPPPLWLRPWPVPTEEEEVSLFPTGLSLPDTGRLGHRCFTSEVRGGSDLITQACSSLKRCGSQPFQKAVWQRVFQGPGKSTLSFPVITRLGNCSKGTDCKTRKERLSAR